MNKLTEYKLSDLYKMDSGISTKPGQAGHGFPFVSFSTIFNNIILPDDLNDLMDTSSEERQTYSITRGDILITRTSENLNELAMSSVALKDFPNATFSGFAKRLRPINNNITYPEFMAFFMRSSYFRKLIDNNATMTLRASFNDVIFSNLKISLPSYDEQMKIGDFLSNIESKIKINNKIKTELDSMIDDLYVYWFLQLDFPDKNGRPYKSSGGKMVWNEDLKREIPEGWGSTNLGENDLCSVITNGIDKFDSKIYLATANIENEEIFNGKKVTYENRENRANMQPSCLSVWFAKMKNSVKHIFIPKNSEWFTSDYILSTGMYGLQCNEITFPYVCSYIKNKNFEIRKNTLSHGSTQMAVNDGDLNGFKTLRPSDDILEKYSNLVNPVFEMKFSIIRENKELSSLRDYLLPLFINGQAYFKE